MCTITKALVTPIEVQNIHIKKANKHTHTENRLLFATEIRSCNSLFVITDKTVLFPALSKPRVTSVTSLEGYTKVQLNKHTLITKPRGRSVKLRRAVAHSSNSCFQQSIQKPHPSL